MFCPKCGKENKEGAKFCKGCGAELPSKPVEEIKVEEEREARKKAAPVAKAPTPNVGKMVAIVMLILFAFFLLIRWGCQPQTLEDREMDEAVQKTLEDWKRQDRRDKFLRERGLK